VKPPPFDFHDPASVDEALALLAEHGDDAKVLAGGQSLIPLLSFRLARPELLIDVNRVAELASIDAGPGGALTIGATTRQAAVERSALAATACPLLRDALRFVAHPQIRNRGTLGGSVAHADPAAELPVAMVATEATLVARRRGEERRIAAEDFFVSHLTTTLEDDELLVAVELPATPPRSGTAFEEFARRSGDYALGGAAAIVTLDAAGACTRARIALLGAADVPLRARGAEELLLGRRIDAEAAREAAAAAVVGAEPIGNVHGDAAYRRRVVEAMCARALAAAAARAAGVAA
jgi:carbon-monoxide dehydrogenase medium subunit/6-hydroxypseudooxynicotine dehydrogenase subunit alpha